MDSRMGVEQGNVSHANKKFMFILRNRSGSVEHYYHFVLGFLVPFVNYVLRSGIVASSSRMTVRDCGPFNKLIEELPFDFEIISKQELEWREKSSRDIQNGNVILDGYDDVGAYDYDVFDRVRSFVCYLFRNEISHNMALFRKYGNAGKHKSAKILLIDRGPPDSFYSLETAEIPRAGTDRRSIPNFSEIVAQVSHFNIVPCKLEGMTLAQQVALFSLADIIVAQHGAALVNLIWAQPKSCVVEISPYQTAKRVHFSHLAACMKQQYFEIVQDHEHASVPPEEILKILEQVAGD